MPVVFQTSDTSLEHLLLLLHRELLLLHHVQLLLLVQRHLRLQLVLLRLLDLQLLRSSSCTCSCGSSRSCRRPHHILPLPHANQPRRPTQTTTGGTDQVRSAWASRC